MEEFLLPKTSSLVEMFVLDILGFFPEIVMVMIYW